MKNKCYKCPEFRTPCSYSCKKTPEEIVYDDSLYSQIDIRRLIYANTGISISGGRMSIYVREIGAKINE